MKSKLLFCLLMTVLLITGSTQAQQAKKVYRIGYLSPQGSFQDSPGLELFRQDLRALGYIEGQNLVIEWRFAKGNADRLPELAAELVRLKPDVIVTSATQPIRALKNATTTIPIVVIGAGDLVGRDSSRVLLVRAGILRGRQALLRT